MTGKIKYSSLIPITIGKIINDLIEINLTIIIIAFLMISLLSQTSFGAGLYKNFDDELIIAVNAAMSREAHNSILQIDVIDSEICGVLQSSDKSFVITGKKLGKTAIVVWVRSESQGKPEPIIFNVRVDTNPDIKTLATKLTEFIKKEFEGRIGKDFRITPSLTNDKVIVSGKVRGKKTIAAILAAMESDQLPSSSIVNNMRERGIFF